MALNMVVSLVVSLLVVLIFEYSKNHQELPSHISTEIKKLYEKLNLVETKLMIIENNLTEIVNIMDHLSQTEETENTTYSNSLTSLENDIDTLKRNHAKGNSTLLGAGSSAFIIREEGRI